MFKAFKTKWKAGFLVLILVVSFLSPMMPNQPQAEAAGIVALITEDIPRKLDKLWTKMETYVIKALKTTVFSALLNVATITTQRLAYDAAMYVSGGGAGGDSLIEPRGFKEYAQMLGEQAMGEFIGTLSQPWSKLGINLCEPSPLQKLEFQKNFTQTLTINNYQVKSQVPAAAKCDWNTIKKSYTALGESLNDFSIDVDLNFDLKLQAGGVVNWDTNTLTGSLKEINDKFTALTEKLFNESGIDISKAWTDAKYLKYLFDDSVIPNDWDNIAELKKLIRVLRESVYKIVDEKMMALEKQVKNDRESSLAKLLYDGELSFWWEVKNNVDAGTADTRDATYKSVFGDTNRLQILIKNKLIDRTLIMRLFSENKISISILKYMFLDDLKAYLKQNGDDLSSFASFLEPGKNPGSVALSLGEKFTQKSAELANKATQLANNQGFKNVTDIVSGRIKTPATVVQEQFKQQQIKDPSEAKWSAITGAYFNADVGTALLNVALSTFTSTVFNNLMTKVYTGIFKPDQMINQNKVTVGLSQAELKKRYASTIQSELLSLNYQLNNYNLLDEFIICPEKYENSNNCVIDADWAQLLRGGEYMTVQEALNSGYLKANWPLIAESNPLNGDKYCYQKAYCFDNLQKLRRARVLPVGFELAASLCEDPANAAICTNEDPVLLGEVVSNFYNCGQDEDHPYSIWCNLIDPNWLLKAPAMKCRVQGYSEDVVSDELPQRKEVCVDDVSCIAEDSDGNCSGWGYCTKEKNIWRFSMADECEPVEDSCRTFTDSNGAEFSFLKNTLWITEFNTCDSTNVGCAWYSRNKSYDLTTDTWQWTDNKTATGEATDRIYFNNKVQSCSIADEGCSRVVRAIPRLGTNLLPNSSFKQYTKFADNLYSFDNWETTASADLRLYNEQALLETDGSSPAYQGIKMKDPVYIIPKDEVRYFIYSAKLMIPAYLLDKASDSYYNLDHQWSLTIDAYKAGASNPQSSYVYNLLGKAATTQSELENNYLSSESNSVEVDLFLRFTTVVDIDRLRLGLLSLDASSTAVGNQVIIEHLQLEEVGQYDINPSEYNEYNSSNLVYVKKAPAYYNCYKNWYEYKSASQCATANGVWNSEKSTCAAPEVCNRFAPYCSINEVGCELFIALNDGEKFTGVVNTDDYCPEICSGYGRYYESATRFSNGQYLNFIPKTASSCSYDAVGCEEYTSVADDSGVERKAYFTYNRTCELVDSPDCQLFYTWDNPDSSGTKEISRYFLKALNNEPLISKDDALLCNESIYNAGTNPSCYKFYAVQGGENIDLSVGSSEYVSYHLIDYTVTCSADCKPYRLTRQVTEAQCLDAVTDLNQFKATGTKTLADGSTVRIGTCTVYTVFNENPSCSAAYNGCREYRGSQSNSYFTLLSDSFEDDLNNDIWSGAIIVEDSVSYNGHSLNNLSAGGVIRADIESYLLRDELYLLSFWARTSLASSNALTVSLSSSDQAFSGENGIVLTEYWQKYTLGPIQANANSENPVLTFSGIASGNLYIDSVELREITDSYYYVADTWITPDVCDQLPGTNLTVPGYMLGCQGYKDSVGYTHYLKSFSDSCRESAVGCELVIDTQNNLEFNASQYNNKIVKSIGNLVLPLISSEGTCVLGGYNWDNGRCYHQFNDDKIKKTQCELWGYYWLGDASTGECVSETLGDNVAVAGDKLISLVINDKYLCSTDKLGCSAFGKASLDENGEIIECNYGSVCSVSKGCACRLEETNNYVCTVPFGEESCTMDTVYLVDNPLQYDNILCEANAAGCDEFADSDSGTWYFRNPGNRLCEYKEVRIDGQLKRGWFKSGTNEACYENYKPMFGLWGFDQNLDYYVAGVDDLSHYNFYAATCSPKANKCTNFIDPTATAANRNYYYIWNENIDTASCNGQVNLAEGCVLFNNTAKNSLIYSAEKTYANNLSNDYRAVTPYLGVADKTLNPFTSYSNPFYLGDNILDNKVNVSGYIPLIDSSGAIQYFDYRFAGLLSGTSSVGGIISDLAGVGSVGIIGGSSSSGSNISGQIGMEVPNLGIDNLDNLVNLPNIQGIYFDILENNAQSITESANYNNSNMVVKVKRDRVCAEWLDSGDSQVVHNAKGNAIEVSSSLVACQDFVSSSDKTQCTKAIVGPPQKLDVYNYTLRGFGWDILDYSGYSVPNMYGLQHYKQIYLSEEKRTILGVDMQLTCNSSIDCSATNASNYRCVNNRCYNIYNGKNSLAVSKSDQLPTACRAYPREDAPLAYNLGVDSSFNGGATNTCYPYVGQCVNIFTGISSYSGCSNNMDCADAEECIFSNNQLNDTCLCDYQKVLYEDSAKTVYTSIDDKSFSSQGLCVGGVNDGLTCQSNLDCQSGNRTSFRVNKENSGISFEGVCVYPQSVTEYYGLTGICLEKAANGNCLTWYPVDRFIGKNDLYDQDPKTAYPEDRKYYCLNTATIIPVLRQGGHSVMQAVQCPENRFGVDLSDNIMPADVAAGKMYYVVDRREDGENCDRSEFRKQLLYNGAVVKIDDAKWNAIVPDWSVKISNFNDDQKKVAQNNLIRLYQVIKARWQGQSCLYMITDLYSIVPEYFYGGTNYWEGENVYIAELGEGNKTQATEYPIVVTCRPAAFESWKNNETDKINGAGGELDYYGIDPFMHTATGNIAKAVPVIISEIKDIYARYNNLCDIAFQTVGGEYSGSDQEKENERRTREFIYLINNVCEYQNLVKEDNLNLYNSILTKRPDDSDASYSERKNAVLPEGEYQACNILAEVVDEEGNYKAYTNRLSSYSNYISEIRDKAAYTPFAKVSYNDELNSNCNTRVDDLALTNKITNWRAINPGKYYDLSRNTYPAPFGAVAGSSLYFPYQIPYAALPFSKQLYFNYLGMNTENSRNDHGNDLDWDFDCVAKLDPVAFSKNLLFDLFRDVYSIKSYKMDSSIQENGQTLSGIFAIKPYASYKDVDMTDKNDPFFAAYWKDVNDFALSLSSSCKYEEHAGSADALDDDDDCVYVGIGYYSADGSPLFNDERCVMGSYTEEEDDGSSTTVNFCKLNDDSPDYQDSINEYIETWTANHPFSTEGYLAKEYGMFYNEETGTYQAKPTLYYLPEAATSNDSLVEIDCEDADVFGCWRDMDGDGEVENYTNALNHLLYDGAVQGTKVNLSVFDLQYTNDKNYGSTTGVQGAAFNSRYLPIVFKNVNNVETVAANPGEDVSPLEYYYKEIIQDNSLYELSFYAQANRETMPIRRVRVDWGDGQVEDLQDYKFKNHLPVCNTAGAPLDYDMNQDLESLEWKASIDLNSMKSTVSDVANQGTAAAPENCVEAPFVFKHWFTNVKGYNADGDLMCNKGIPLTINGTVASSPDGEDVVKCMLQGSVSITDNFGYERVHPMLLYVNLRYNLFGTFFKPLLSDSDGWTNLNWIAPRYEASFSIYTASEDDEEDEETGGLIWKPIPFVINP